jgi:hypothetical protein
VAEVCRKAKIPFNEKKTRTLAGDKSQFKLYPKLFEEIPAKEVLLKILDPMGLRFDLDKDGLFLRQKNSPKAAP